MSDRTLVEEKLCALGKLAPAGYFAGLHIRFTSPLLTFQTYCQEWADHYTDNGYALRDPMTAWAFSTQGATRWSQVGLPDPFGILREAARFGLRFGAHVSHGPIRSRSIVAVARSDREFLDSEIRKVAEIAQQLHALTEPPERLTRAQVEALRLIAGGKRYVAAASELKISVSALKARLNSARQRLMARTNAEAIQRAKDSRLL